MFLLQMFLAFQDVIYLADNIDHLMAKLGIEEFSWVRYRHSTEWLAGVEANRTWTNGTLVYTLGCKKFVDVWPTNGPQIPLCPAWYRLLIGELHLREGTFDSPEGFNVRTLAQCLLALSGPVFLMIISGNVRKAYLKFYVDRKILRRKQKRSRSVNVVPAAAGL
ncbi:hypothetical protein AAVH_25845 [Aphelenchoides avenae]|nr:hypothetical protein AAVH_25845 [Aphelenchus avenae]